jgi:hypothetical protein
MSADQVQEALHAALDADPADQMARRALADWHEENGEQPAAEALRWLAEQGKRPIRYYHEWVWHNPPSGQYRWSSGSGGRMRRPGQAETLPQPLWDQLRGHTWENRGQVPHFWKPYATRRAAEEAVCWAFPLARAAGWQPEG